jgi:hypothetical protein
MNALAHWDTVGKQLLIPILVRYTDQQKKDLECIIVFFAHEYGIQEDDFLKLLQSRTNPLHPMYQYLTVGILVSMGLHRRKSKSIVSSVFGRSEDRILSYYQIMKRRLFVKRVGSRSFFKRTLSYIPEGDMRWEKIYVQKDTTKNKPKIEVVTDTIKMDTQKFDELRARVYSQLKFFPISRSAHILLSSIQSFSGINKETLVLAQGRRSNGSRVRTKRVYADLRKIFFSAMKEVYGNKVSLIFLASFFTPLGEEPNHSNVQLSVKDHKFLIENDKYYMDTFFIFLAHTSFILDAYLLHEEEFARLEIDVTEIETKKKEIFDGIILSARKNLAHVHTENKRTVVVA